MEKRTQIDIFMNEPFMREIIRCQNEISNLDPCPYYLEAYKDAEIFYWLNIPKWLYEDKGKVQVKNCLDIGCAYGTLALFCKKVFNCDIYCIDIHDFLLSKLLIEKYNFSFKVNNIELDTFPWKEVRFEIIIFTEVLEHLNFNVVPTLKKIRKQLSRNGKIYLSTPDASQWGKLPKYKSYKDMPMPERGIQIIDDHIYQFHENELLEVLEKAGLKIEKFGYSPGAANLGRHFNLIAIKK